MGNNFVTIKIFFYLSIFILFLNCGCKTSRLQLQEDFSLIEKHIIPAVPFYKQRGNTCGPSAVASILDYWRIQFDYPKLIKELYAPGFGGSLDFEIAFYPRQFSLWSNYSQSSFAYLKE
ncbi:MAG: hypothetical protein NC927_01325, partial [Candidatus Omnitrophica bacterium]|nr:hypothetical protein [Candidatus Omnitrophota bacterium]